MLDLFTDLNGQMRIGIDTEYAFVNGPIGPERNMGLGLSILNQREVFTNYNYVQVNGCIPTMLI
jgi:hypothetical protein